MASVSQLRRMIQMSTPHQEIVTDDAVASFDTDFPAPMGVKAEFSPVQDLHGYDHPWPAGGGKNLLDIANASLAKPSWYSATWSNASLNDRNGLTLPKTYNQGGCGGFTITAIVGDYVISFLGDGNSSYNCGIWLTTDGTDMIEVKPSYTRMTDDGGGRHYLRFTIPATAQSVCFRPTLVSGTVPYNVYDLMIEAGSTPTAYASYSNVCPITGRTGANIYNEETYDASATPKLTINWQSSAGTVYGGYVQINEDGSGSVTEVVEKKKLPTSYRTTLTTRNGELGFRFNNFTTGTCRPVACDIAKVVNGISASTNITVPSCAAGGGREVRICIPGWDATTFADYIANNDIYVVTELAEPQTYPLTADQIKTLLGENCVFSNLNSSVTVRFFKHG